MLVMLLLRTGGEVPSWYVLPLTGLRRNFLSSPCIGTRCYVISFAMLYS